MKKQKNDKKVIIIFKRKTTIQKESIVHINLYIKLSKAFLENYTKDNLS